MRKAKQSESSRMMRPALTKERIEKEILEKQKELIEAKTQNLKSIENSEKLYADALKAFRGYSGHGDEVDDA